MPQAYFLLALMIDRNSCTIRGLIFLVLFWNDNSHHTLFGNRYLVCLATTAKGPAANHFQMIRCHLSKSFLCRKFQFAFLAIRGYAMWFYVVTRRICRIMTALDARFIFASKLNKILCFIVNIFIHRSWIPFLKPSRSKPKHACMSAWLWPFCHCVRRGKENKGHSPSCSLQGNILGSHRNAANLPAGGLGYYFWPIRDKIFRELTWNAVS